MTILADMPRRLIVLALLGLFLLTLYLYWDTLSFGFVFFDDQTVLLGHPNLFGQASLWDNVYAILIGEFPRSEPLLIRDLSWLVDSRVFGFGNPFAYHYFNLLYHGLVVCCAFLFLFLLTRQLLPALVAAGVYSILAVHVEPVAWIMGRKDILANLFLLLLLICELKFQRSRQTPSKAFFYCCTLVLLGLACLSKISAITYPIVLLALKLLLPAFDRQQHPPRVIVAVSQVLPHLVISLAIYVWYRGVLGDFGILQLADAFDTTDYVKILLIINPLVLLEYLKLLVYPHALSVSYTWQGLSTDLTWLQGLLAIGTLIATVGLGVFLLKKRRDLLFFYLSFFILMLPYANLVNFGWWYANRYLYASVLFLIAPIIMVCFERRKTPLAWVLGLLIGVVVGSNIYAHQRYLPVWKSGESLWAHETGLPGANLRAHGSRIAYYLSARSMFPPDQSEYWLQKADTAIEEALAIYWPDRTVQPPGRLFLVFYYQGAVRNLSGQPLDKQLESFEMAYALRPDFHTTSEALGQVYYELARAATNDDERRQYARTSLDYYNRFFTLTDQSPSGSNRQPTAYKNAIYKELTDHFPFLADSELEP